MHRGQADCACLQRRQDEGRRTCHGQSRERAEEVALHGLVRACSVIGQGFNQLRMPLQARRGGSLESHCGEAPQHRETLHSDVAYSAGWIEDGTREEGDRLPHQG